MTGVTPHLFLMPQKSGTVLLFPSKIAKQFTKQKRKLKNMCVLYHYNFKISIHYVNMQSFSLHVTMNNYHYKSLGLRLLLINTSTTTTTTTTLLSTIWIPDKSVIQIPTVVYFRKIFKTLRNGFIRLFRQTSRTCICRICL